MRNFDQLSNGKVCSCGRHHGVGTWDPERRAAIYKWTIKEIKNCAKPHQYDYVKDWELNHGPIKYVMGVVDVNTGTFNKNDKGKDVRGPIFVKAA